MQNNIMFSAGMQIKAYEVFRPSDVLDEKGRALKGALNKTGEFAASTASATEREILKYKQVGRDVSHVLVAKGRHEVQAEDILASGGVKYRVCAVEDPALVGMYTLIYCERKGVG